MARWCPPPWCRSRIRIRTIGRTGRIRGGGGSRTTTRRTTTMTTTTMRRPRYDGLRQRYLALLVPAIARINRELSGRAAYRQRAAAVRRAIDTCLVRAAASSITMDPISQNPNNLLKKPLQKKISNPLHTPPSPIQAAPSKMHISRVKRLCPTLLNPNSCAPSRRWRKESFHGDPAHRGHVRRTIALDAAAAVPDGCHVMAHGGSTIIPSQEELRKLQSVLICPNKFESMNRRPAYCNLLSATGLIPPSLGTNDNDNHQISLAKDTNKDYYYYYDDDDYGKSLLNLGLGSFVSQYSAAIIEEEDEEEAEHAESIDDALSIIGTDTNTDDRDINPVIVLTQAAQHILAMQFQVDALQALLAD